jgi:uncharacterized low-complexity protein
MNKTHTRVGLLTCAALAGSLGVSATASALTMTELVQGYALAAQAAPKAVGKAAEGKCGEGKCGADKPKTTPKPAAAPQAGDKKGAEGKCGEGKCGARH